jgi:hypothetical protein
MDLTTIREYAENPAFIAGGEAKMQEILGRSATDVDFRRKLVDSPRAALAEALGGEVPESFDVRFIENRASATIVLPDYIDDAAQLSEEQLEAVAGGSEPISTTVITIGVLGAIAAGITLGIEAHKASCDAH